MGLLSFKESNVDYVVKTLVAKLKVGINSKSILDVLHKHPEYPSMLAISDCLYEFNIDNQAYKINKEEYNSDDLFFPFLAHSLEDGGRYLLIENINAGEVSFTDERHQKSSISEEEFLKRWDGIALHAEKNDHSGEVNYNQNRLKYILQNLILPIGFILILSFFYLVISTNSLPLATILLSLIKLVGVGISVLLLMQSINSNNPFIQNLCSFGSKGDCNAILKTDAAKITDWLSWSEVGFFYFVGSLLSLFFVPLSILAWLNLLALPYTVYSITYQYRNKKWCVLCCTIQIVLVLEALTFTLGFGLSIFTLNFQASSIYLLPLCFLSPIIIWAFLKPFFVNAAQLEPLQQQLKRFKYNGLLFNQALTNQPKYAINDELLPIVLGNPEAKTIITMVSNPFCSPCGKAHETIDKWLKNGDNIQLKVLFTTSNHDEDPRAQVVRHLTTLNQLNDKVIVEKALIDWYNGNKKYEEWAEKYPVSFIDGINEAIENQLHWCEIADITFTPTILINGHKLPEPYKLKDLKYLIT